MGTTFYGIVILKNWEAKDFVIRSRNNRITNSLQFDWYSTQRTNNLPFSFALSLRMAKTIAVDLFPKKFEKGKHLQTA